jgi:HK97 family phage prohead protease
MDRAYSILTVKSVDEDRRVIRGVATTPDADRMGDVVVPTGVKFKNPLPLLWQHQSDKPVGTVAFDTPTDKGIGFEATLPNIVEPGALKDRVDEAWQSVKAGLISAVSIGFRALENGAEIMKTGGIKFTSTEVLELSLVTIPANASAVITAIKSIDQKHLPPASGQKADSFVEGTDSPGVSGTKKAASRGAVKLIPRIRK